MRVVITGGSGLVGRALVAELARRSHLPVVVSRTPARQTGFAPQVELAGWDGVTAQALVPILEGADAVVHLAGESIASGRWTTAKKKRIRESRTVSTRALTDALRQCTSRPGVLVQGSAVGYYGARRDEEVEEGASPGDDFLAQVCREWEAASSGVEEMGVRRIVVRTGVVLSPRGGALPKMVLPFRLFAGGPLGDGQQWLPWIHIDDEVGAIGFLLESEAEGPFNLVSPTPVTNRAFSRLLGSVLGRPSWLPTPSFALRLALGEMATLLLGGQRAVPGGLRQLGYQYRFPTLEEALRELLG
jgi:uncharacterized protein (TIGR01777 family)